MTHDKVQRCVGEGGFILTDTEQAALGRCNQHDESILRRCFETVSAYHEARASDFAALQSECEALRADAERYRWLRPRIEVRNIENMRGDKRKGMDVRIGHTYFDSKTEPGKGWVSLTRFDESCAELDAAIDTAIASTVGRIVALEAR